MPDGARGTPEAGWAHGLRRAMDGLYWLSVALSGTSLVVISLVIPWGVFTRYGLNSASSWPEPMAILLAIVLTFFGAAACYRAQRHVSVTFVVDNFPPGLRRAVNVLAEALVALLGAFMVVWGVGLCEATWHETIAEFPALRVGITYLPIPSSGAIIFLFVLERLILGPPPYRELPEEPAVVTAD